MCLYPDLTNIAFDITNKYSGFYSITKQLTKNFGFDIVSFPSIDQVGFARKFDAYYGSSSPLVPVFSTENIPVMIADYNITL